MTRARLLAIAAFLLLFAPQPALACPVCFQNVESGLLDAARLGVLALVAVTVGVLMAFGRWFLKLRRLAAIHGSRDNHDRGSREEPC